MHFILSLLGLLITTPVYAQNVEAECGAAFEIPVIVETEFADVVYDYSQNIEAIATQARDHAHTLKENLTLGLTRYQPILQFSMPMKGIQFADGRVCAHVDHVDVRLGYGDVTVLVASEIPEFSCGFNEVVAHEERHVAVTREILAEFQPRIEERLKAYVQNNGVFRNMSGEEAKAELQQRMQHELDQLNAEMAAENIKRQSEVDTMDEYKRITYACNGQLAHLAARYLKMER